MLVRLDLIQVFYLSCLVYPRVVSWVLYCFLFTLMIYSPHSSFQMLFLLLIIRNVTNFLKLQQDLDSLSCWSSYWNFFFNSSKFIHLSFNLKFPASFFINGNPITESNTHQDLDIIVSSHRIIVTFLPKPTKLSAYLDVLFLIL